MLDDLTKIKGIGTVAANKLKEAGFNSIKKLANSTVEELSKVKGIGPTSAKKWIESAKILIGAETASKVSSTVPINKSKPKKPLSTSTTSQSHIHSSIPEFKDTAEPIPHFLLNRLSKKALKILNMSYSSISRETLKTLQNYQKILTPERIKFDPAYQDEKNVIIAIEEKSKLIENLILNHKENESNKFLQNHIIKPMKNGIFKQYTDRLSEYFGPEECAIKIYDSLNKKVKKSYPFTEISFIRE
ncbi:MAG: helix-hairpin-helix domain-containing protein, partial [Promethearchaeota archaeon]